MQHISQAFTPAQIVFSLFIVILIFSALLINLKKRNDEDGIKKIPSGFVEANFGLLLNKNSFQNLKTIIMPLLIRDYLFYYSSTSYDNKSFSVEFYIRPKEEASFMYRLGIYSQTIENYQTVEKLKNNQHTIPQNFPECIEIKIEN